MNVKVVVVFFMSGINETRFSMNYESGNVDRIKVYVIQNKNEITLNVGVSVKNNMIGLL